jgi:hypothetical protein
LRHAAMRLRRHAPASRYGRSAAAARPRYWLHRCALSCTVHYAGAYYIGKITGQRLFLW